MPTGLLTTGFAQLVRDLKQADAATSREVKATLRQVGDNVKQDSADLFRPYDARTAAGYRTYVRQRGISVEQSIRKTTGKHPEFGTLQMRRALLPALDRNEPDLERRMTEAIDRVCAGI